MQVSNRRGRGLKRNEGEIDREESLRHGNIPKGDLTSHDTRAHSEVDYNKNYNLSPLVVICPIERMLIIKSMQAVC